VTASLPILARTGSTDEVSSGQRAFDAFVQHKSIVDEDNHIRT
jgi:hypothetical protein